MKLKRIEAALLCAVLVASLCSVTSFASSCAQIRESVLRLHVLANSDSDADQALKLQVRDAVLEEGAHIFDGSLTAGGHRTGAPTAGAGCAQRSNETGLYV